MDALLVVLSLLASLVLLDLAAIRWGADSRHVDGERRDWW